MGFVPRTPSFANPSFLESPAPVTGHSYLLHALRVFVRMSGVTCMQNVPLPLTHSPTVSLHVTLALCAVVRFACYNNSPTHPPEMTPFLAHYSFHRQTQPIKQREAHNPGATMYAHCMQDIHQQAKQTLENI